MKPTDLPVCVRAGHRARWLPDGDATFAAMLALIAKARESVCLETYMIRPGEPAESLRAALLEARARGLQVRVMYDAFGSEGLPITFFMARKFGYWTGPGCTNRAPGGLYSPSCKSALSMPRLAGAFFFGQSADP